MRRKALVMGASGFVGSHVTRKLAERGDDVRVYLRKSSKTMGIDDLDVERCYGDLYDEEALRAAMADRDVVYYCVVDTRFHLRDPAPLFETNVNCLQRVLDIATDADLHRFVFCSTIGTIALGEGRPATEDDAFNWPGIGGPYIESRRQAEDLVLRYARERGLPAVALNVSNPYGPLDYQPNQGLMVKLAAQGQLPVWVKGVSTEVVGIEDVAEAFLLAAEHGRVGERYIISESYLPMRTRSTPPSPSISRAPTPACSCWSLSCTYGIVDARSPIGSLISFPSWTMHRPCVSVPLWKPSLPATRPWPNSNSPARRWPTN